jgi:16S rRNA (adenine1518-N6/adenine1519-N6)-dimethyltransferase
VLTPADIRALAVELDLRPSKARGQNFLLDANVVRRIVRTAELEPDDVVLEVGPGLGSLTLGLLPAVRRVVAVEIERSLADRLPRTVAEQQVGGDLEVICADALKLTGVPGPEPTALVANLPYNVATPVLLTLLERLPSLRRGLVMVQAEVVDRLVAAPGSRVYGVPSVKLAWWASARRAGSISRSVFWPAPNVDSALLAFARRPPPVEGEGLRRETFNLVDAAFSSRRKTLRAALAGRVGSAADAEALLRAAGIDPGARGESLTVTDFARLAQESMRA